MNCVRRYETHSDEQTREVGRELASVLPRQGLVLLTGDLGAGKTTLTKGIVEGLGAAPADSVSSPTFTLIHEYGEPVRVYHIDLYRLESAEEARQLGLEDLLESGALVLIEWGERFPELWPASRVEVRITDGGGENRIISISM